ncbi:MAG: hypothetical protein ACE147_18345 [Candidatus Methylomirabilales bacterium]
MPTIIGSVGVALLLVAFLLNLVGWLPARRPAYSLLNLLGAGLAGYSSWLIGFLPFVVLEGVWTAVAAVALARQLAHPPDPDSSAG